MEDEDKKELHGSSTMASKDRLTVKSDLVTFMKNSVAKRCKNMAFHGFITEFFIGKLGMA